MAARHMINFCKLFARITKSSVVLLGAAALLGHAPDMSWAQPRSSGKTASCMPTEFNDGSQCLTCPTESGSDVVDTLAEAYPGIFEAIVAGNKTVLTDRQLKAFAATKQGTAAMASWLASTSPNYRTPLASVASACGGASICSWLPRKFRNVCEQVMKLPDPCAVLKRACSFRTPIVDEQCEIAKSVGLFLGCRGASNWH